MKRQATLLGSIAAIALAAGPSSAQPASPFDREFYFRMLGNRCLDFGGEAFWAPSSLIHPLGLDQAPDALSVATPRCG